ncbi:uncharacterized protein LOC107004614 [Solanum pennellii]|uniref:Uncharacterized protein LOC107004614 n=1 Tax=Solanum pennellii TaxID=28526 RepID=A0ABM1FKV6_SOLPN|nr:uncharacterized protein LOC107004614 [Solanum pennellii]
MKKLYRKGTVHPSPPLISDQLSFLPVAILTLAAALSQEDKQVLAYLISCSSGDFSGNRRTTHKSNTSNPSPPTSNPVAGDFSGELSGDFSGSRGNTHFKSATPNSGSEKSSGGNGSKSFSAVHGVAHGGVHGGADHLSSFNCYCFSCYMSYWVKWDSSPNRQLIHEILDAYEDGLQSKKEKSKKERRNKNGSSLKQNGSSLKLNGSSNGDVGSSTELKKSSSELSLNKNGSGSVSGFGSGQSDPVEETSGGGGGAYEDESGGVEKGTVRKFVSFLGERIWSVWT